MDRRPDHQRLQLQRGRMAWIAVALALLVLTTGLSRLFVVCLGHHGEPRVETAHAGGCCNENEHSSGEHPDCDHGSCVDRSTLMVAMPPLPADLALPAAEVAWLPPAGDCGSAAGPQKAWARTPLRPPRCGQHLLLRAGIVLLL